MNNRIQELMKQANLQPYYDSQEKDIEKFAELIVRECIDCLKPLSRNHSMVGAARDTIKEHFGVE
jgi:hypothetical protein